MPNRRMGQARGRQTILECVITAFPQTVNYWEKDGRKLSSSAKYHVDVYDDGAQRIVLYVPCNASLCVYASCKER